MGIIFHPLEGKDYKCFFSYMWYMLSIGGLYATYHLLGEPETTIDIDMIVSGRWLVSDRFYVSLTSPWGDDPISPIFSKGLVQPTSKDMSVPNNSGKTPKMDGKKSWKCLLNFHGFGVKNLLVFFWK